VTNAHATMKLLSMRIFVSVEYCSFWGILLTNKYKQTNADEDITSFAEAMSDLLPYWN